MTRIISKAQAELIGKADVEKQNQILGEQRYKFVRVGNLDECWAGYEGMKYYKKNRSIFVWRIDGAQFASNCWNGDEGHWTKKRDELVNTKNEFWYCVADYMR